MTNVEKLLEAMLCKLVEFDAGFGDSTDSAGGDLATGGTFVNVVGVARPSIVYLRNTGANEVEVTANDAAAVGARIAAGAAVVFDRFQGTLFARSTTGASTLNWCTFVRQRG